MLIKIAVEAENTRTPDFWFENSATWREIDTGTVSDEVVCGRGLKIIGNWEKFEITTDSWWRKISAIPGWLPSHVIYPLEYSVDLLINFQLMLVDLIIPPHYVMAL